jgi:transcriptional regulator with XRE-family HTH domain
MSEERDANLSFAALLRRYRHAAELTQAQLAERAGLSARAISTAARELSWEELVGALVEEGTV